MEFLKLYIDHAIFGLLGIMSILALAYTFERLVYYHSIKLDKYKDIHHLERDLTQNLTILSIISSNAPYVGLFGTVIGVIITFYDMGQSQGLETSAILSGLSLALKATAAGLLVAIPSLMAYSGFLRKTDVIMSKWKSKNES